MSALLRQGARRLGGSVLQRTQAAVTSPAIAEERRRLVPRRMYSTEELSQLREAISSNPFNRATNYQPNIYNDIDSQATAEITRKIQQKKEELYDVICKAEQSFWTSSFRNKLLLQKLSVEVKPRPADTKWQILRFTKRAVNVVDAAGFIALTSLVYSFALGVRSFIQDRSVVRYMMMKEMAKAREAETRSGLMENQS